MIYVKLLLSLLTTLAIIWLAGKTWIVGQAADKKQTPRFGQFFSPVTGFWQNAEAKKPVLKTKFEAANLSAPVSVVYDDRLVPHIFADNTKDAYYVQGYVTASLRLWQMEFQTQAAAGRLSEIIGNTKPQVLELDKKARRMGLPQSAKKAVEFWKKDTAMFTVLQSYCDGVNAYISSLSVANYPLEYKILD